MYCGTESGVYVSFDAGDHWQSLQLNLPASSMRDLVVHEDDLVLATYGRALWILDDVTPLRQIGTVTGAADVQLLKPAPAIRARWDVNGDTPLPIETPTAQNPPDGAIIDYSLKAIPDGDITLTMSDAHGRIVRTFASVAAREPKLPANVPSYWFAPAAELTKNRGLNRFAWNLRYPSPKILPFGYFGSLLPYVEYTLAEHAIPGQTPRDQPEGPLVLPGEYTIELSAGGRRDRQTLTVRPDPRVRASTADLAAQLELATRLIDALAVTYDGYSGLKDLRSTIAERVKAIADARQAKDAKNAVDALEKKIEAIQTGTAALPGLGLVNRDMARLSELLLSGDARPADQLQASVAESCQVLTAVLDSWRRLNAMDLPAVNSAIARLKLPPFAEVIVPAGAPCVP
jgi:hypothetical protein